VRFIWEKHDHFLDHVERGRRRRLAEERATPLATEAAGPPHSRERIAALLPMPNEVIAELDRLFGPGWGKTHVPR
jgi:hypothetical protein